MKIKMNAAIAAVMVLGFLMIGVTGASASIGPTNLLSDPGFEEQGSAENNWLYWGTAGTSTKGKVERSNELVLSGSWAAEFWADDNVALRNMTASQKTKVAITGGDTYYASAYLNSPYMEEGDSAWVSLAWYDGNTKISEIDSAKIYSGNDQWDLFEVSGAAPLNATSANLFIHFNAPVNNPSALRQLFADDAFLGAPEPISAALFLLGGAGLAIGRRRTKKS